MTVTDSFALQVSSSISGCDRKLECRIITRVQGSPNCHVDPEFCSLLPTPMGVLVGSLLVPFQIGGVQFRSLYS